MSEQHQLGVYAKEQTQLEAVDPLLVKEGLGKARLRTIEVLNEIRAALKPGMGEEEARLLALATFANHGVQKHWHKPWIRFGEGTVLSFYDPISRSKLCENDIYHLDLGPVWPAEVLGIDGDLEYEGDYGDSFVFGKNEEAEKMINTLHNVFHEVKQIWRSKNNSGEALYHEFKNRIQQSGYVFVDKVDGHRISEFPHHKYTKERLSKIAFVPSESVWILEAMICHPTRKMGAFYEDILS